MTTEIAVKNSGFVVLNKKSNPTGDLIIAESEKEIPFAIKRVYYIHNLINTEESRGKHAHKELQQVIFCIHGSFKLLLDDGTSKQEVIMNQDNKGIILGRMLWHEMSDFSPDCVMLVFASDYYNESDYIRNYDNFMEIIKK